MKMFCKDYALLNITVHTKKPHKTPSKHKGKCHPVGCYPGHLKKSKAFFNNLDNIKADTQMSKGIMYQMENPQPLTNKEQEEARAKGLTVHKGFVI